MMHPGVMGGGRGQIAWGSFAHFNQGLRHLQHDLHRDRVADDELASHYSGISEDDRPNASALLAADALLSEEDGKAAAQKASEALHEFKQQGDQVGVVKASRLLVSGLCLSGEVAQAMKVTTETLEACRQKSDKRGAMRMLLSLAEVHLYMGHPVEALEQLEAAEAQCQEIEDKRLKADAAAELKLMTCQVQRALDSPNDAILAAEEALELFKELGDEHGEAQSLLAKAQTRLAEGFIGEAIDLGQASLAVAKKVGNERLQVSVLQTLCEALLDGSPQDARSCAEEASKLCKSLGFSRGESLALHHLVLAAAESGNQMEALQYANAAVRRFETDGSSLRCQAWAQDTLAHAHLGSESKREALQAEWKAMELLRDAGEKRTYSRSLLLVAMLHLINGQEAWAEQAANEAKRISEEMEDKKGEGLAGYVQVFVCVLRDDTDGAVAAADAAQTIFQETGDKRWLACTALTLCQVHRAAGSAKQALHAAMRAQWRFDDAGDRKGSNIALLEAAEIAMEASAIPKAIKHATRARSVAQEIGYRRGTAIALHVGATAEITLGNVPEALRLGRHARDTYRSVADDRGEAMALVVVADACIVELANRCKRMAKYELDTEDYEKTELTGELEFPKGFEAPPRPLGAPPDPATKDPRNSEYEKDYKLQDAAAQAATAAVKEAVSFSKGARDAKDVHVSALQSNARLLLIQGQTKEALELVERSLTAARASGDKYKEAVGLALCGEVKMQMDAAMEAAKLAHEAMTIFKKLEDSVGTKYALAVSRYIAGEDPLSSEGVPEAGADPSMPAGFASSAGAVVEAGGGGSGFQMEVVIERVGELARQSLGTDEDVVLDSPLMDVGMDSLSSVQFRNDLVKDLGLTLSATLTFDYPSVRAIAEHVLDVARAADGDAGEEGEGGEEEADAAAVEDAGQVATAAKKKKKAKVGAIYVQDPRVGAPSIAGSWNGWEPELMTPSMNGGAFSAVVCLGSNAWESFQIVCDGDWERCVYPSKKDACPAVSHEICGPDGFGHGLNWTIGLHPDEKSKEGACFEITLHVDENDVATKLSWSQLGESDPRTVDLQKKAAALARTDKPFIVGSWNNWSPQPMAQDGDAYLFNLVVGEKGYEAFQVLISGEWKRCVHPKVKDSCPCNPFAPNELIGPDEQGTGVNWCLGAHPLEMAKAGDRYKVKLQCSTAGELQLVDWTAVH